MKYKLKFWFEHSGFCIWATNNVAIEKYGYCITNSKLPISDKLINELNALKEEYHSYLDWNVPQNPSPWTEEHKCDFVSRANAVYEEIKAELGSDFEISNEVNRSVYFSKK